ncbi:MAG: hypothetical protein AAB469_01800 [Patescibacteria group bacterium]
MSVALILFFYQDVSAHDASVQEKQSLKLPIIFVIASAVGDGATTTIGLAYFGMKEVTPVASQLLNGRPWLAPPLKAAGTIGIIYGAKIFRDRGHPRLAKIVLLSYTALSGFATVHNYLEIQKARR